MEFMHIGLTTTEKKADEDWVESTRVWVTNPNNHPFHVEWLRYAPDSPISGPLRDQAHVAYRVDSLAEASRDLKVLLEPFEVGGFARVGFYQYGDGSVVELMEYTRSATEWFKKG
jgi:hypothetical protein